MLPPSRRTGGSTGFDQRNAARGAPTRRPGALKEQAMKRLLILAMLAAPAAQAAYKCTDKSGRTHIGDTPPAQCAEVTMVRGLPLRHGAAHDRADAHRRAGQGQAGGGRAPQGAGKAGGRAAPQGHRAPGDLRLGKGHRHLARDQPEADRRAHQERAGPHRGRREAPEAARRGDGVLQGRLEQDQRQVQGAAARSSPRTSSARRRRRPPSRSRSPTTRRKWWRCASASTATRSAG